GLAQLCSDTLRVLQQLRIRKAAIRRTDRCAMRMRTCDGGQRMCESGNVIARTPGVVPLVEQHTIAPCRHAQRAQSDARNGNDCLEDLQVVRQEPLGRLAAEQRRAVSKTKRRLELV